MGCKYPNVLCRFLGAVSIPVSLLLLGVSFARMKIPRPFSRLPILSIMALAVSKMVILPVIAVFIVQALSHTSLIPKENRMERFVAMLLSGAPTSVNQLVATAMAAPPDTRLDTLATYLAGQYVFMFFSTAALSAVALSLL